MIRIAVCGQIPAVTSVLRRDMENHITEYEDGALLGLELRSGKSDYDLIVVRSYHGEGLPPMEFTMTPGGKSYPVYLIAEPPGKVARIQLDMIIKDLQNDRISCEGKGKTG